jgi:muconolactone D-isomerase
LDVRGCPSSQERGQAANEIVRSSTVLSYRFSNFYGDILLFHVEIVVQIPHDVDPEKTKALSAAEVERAKTLQREGKWLHIWRIVGQWANISVFNVKDGAELHEILTSLPLYLYMKIKVIALCTHPASIEDERQ